MQPEVKWNRKVWKEIISNWSSSSQSSEKSCSTLGRIPSLLTELLIFLMIQELHY